MSSKLITRILIIVSFTLIFGFLGSVVSAESAEIFLQPAVGDCQTCHNVITESYAEGAHGQSGLACETCHSPVNQNHPQEEMPTDISSKKCGSCHTDTHEEFETSVHGEEDLTCIRCHNSHTTTIKNDTVQGMCEDCHNDLTHNFSFSTHADNDVLCTDCHLPMDEDIARVSPGSKVHTFQPNLNSCKSCHDKELIHNVSEPCSEEVLAEAEELGIEPPCEEVSTEDLVAAGFNLPADETLTIEPGSTSPVGFAMIGTLVGMAAGMILSPWLEKWFERFQR